MASAFRRYVAYRAGAAQAGGVRVPLPPGGVFPSGEKGKSSFARKLLRAALVAGVLAAAIALAGRIFPNGKVLWMFVPYDWAKGNPWGLRATGSFANPDHWPITWI